MSALAADLASKRVELLKEVAPRASRVVVLWNSNNQSKVVEWEDTETAARAVGLALRSVELLALEQLDRAFTTILREKPDALSPRTSLSRRTRVSAALPSPIACR
jgi:putative tryptophan/tyrosine transport system substrate-binding protein